MMTTNQARPSLDDSPPTVGVVVVLSRLQLMSQTVAAALRSRGKDVEDVAWTPGVQRASHELTETDTVLLLEDLEDAWSVSATQDLVAQSRARFLILTECPEGPRWGAMLASGAVALMPTDSSLTEVDAALTLVRERGSPMSAARRSALVREWVHWLAEIDDLRARMARLSPRERTVIHLLARGYRVAEIGAELGIAEATVRSQIKSLRRKLGVNSQLEAVALFRRLRGAVGVRRPVLPSPRQPEP